jgi:peroxiredoxin
LRDRIKDFDKRGAQLIAIDPHESYRVRHMLRDVGSKATELTYPILADPAHAVSATYGAAFQMTVHTEVSNRPVTIIVDKNGVIRYERRGKTYGDRPKPDDILQELDKLPGTGKGP